MQLMTTATAELSSLDTLFASPPADPATVAAEGRSIWVFSRDRSSVMLLRRWFGDGAPNNLQPVIDRWLSRPMMFFVVMLDHAQDTVDWYGGLADTAALHETLRNLLASAPESSSTWLKPMNTDPQRILAMLEYWETLPGISR